MTTSRSTTRHGPSSLRLRRNSRMRSVMALFPTARGPCKAPDDAVFQACRRARWGRASVSALQPLKLPWIGKGETPVRTAGKDEQASSVTRAGGGDQQRPRKPDRRCFKPRPLLRAGFAGFASGCRSDFLESFGFSLQAAGGPLVPLPTDRHTATGTCEFGHSGNNKFFARCKRNSSPHAKTFLTNSFRGRCAALSRAR